MKDWTFSERARLPLAALVRFNATLTPQAELLREHITSKTLPIRHQPGIDIACTCVEPHRQQPVRRLHQPTHNALLPIIHELLFRRRACKATPAIN